MGLCWLIESVDESCNDSTTLTSTRPQPDYAVGFWRGEQLGKLQPLRR